MTAEKIDYSNTDFSNCLPFIDKLCPHLNEEELIEAKKLMIDMAYLSMEIYDEAEKEGRLPTEEEMKEFCGESSNPLRA